MYVVQRNLWCSRSAAARQDTDLRARTRGGRVTRICSWRNSAVWRFCCTIHKQTLFYKKFEMVIANFVGERFMFPELNAAAFMDSRQDVSFLLADDPHTADVDPGHPLVILSVDGKALLEKACKKKDNSRYIQHDMAKGHIFLFPAALDLEAQQLQSLNKWTSVLKPHVQKGAPPTTTTTATEETKTGRVDHVAAEQNQQGGDTTKGDQKTGGKEKEDSSAKHEQFGWDGEKFPYDPSRVIEMRLPFAREALLTALAQSCKGTLRL